MLFYITNGIAGLLILFLLGLGYVIDRKNIRSINILTITLTSVLVSLSVILTNIIGYNIKIPPFIIRGITLGNFVNFLIGMITGPFMGVIAGIATDVVGILVNIGSEAPHIGYTFNLAFLGFMGSLVFLKSSKHWAIKTIIVFVFSYALNNFVWKNIWWYATIENWGYIAASFARAGISFPIQMAIYIPLLLTGFNTSYILIRRHGTIDFWAIRHGEVSLKAFTLPNRLRKKQVKQENVV